MSTVVTDRYISDKMLMKLEAKKKRRMIIGIIIVAFFGVGVVGGITGYTEDLRDGVFIYTVLSLPGIWLLWSAYQIGKQNEQARRYALIMEGDQDGIVTVNELAAQMGMDQGRIFSELEVLFRKGYFQSCTLQRGGNPGIILNSGMSGDKEAGFVIVECASCGGKNRIRAGGRGRCEFCGSPVSDGDRKRK